MVQIEKEEDDDSHVSRKLEHSSSPLYGLHVRGWSRLEECGNLKLSR